MATGASAQRSTAALVLIVVLTMVGGSAAASTEDAGSMPPPLRWGDNLVVPAGVDQHGDLESRAMWVWPQGRRAFRMLKNDDTPFNGFDLLTSIDLDTGQEVVRRVLTGNEKMYGAGPNNTYTRGQGHSAVIDPQTGRIFVLYVIPNQVQGASGAAAGRGCPYVETNSICVVGLWVLNGKTLETEADIPIPWLTVSQDGLQPVVRIPRAMQFVPAEVAGDAGKVLLLVEDHVGAPLVFPPQALGHGATLGKFELGRTFALQLDVASKKLDWSTQVRECRSQRESALTAANANVHSGSRPGPGLIMRAKDGAVWVGCFGDSNQSEHLIRLPLNADGRPVEGAAVPALPDQAALSPGDSGTELTPDDMSGAATGESEEYRELFVGPRAVREYWADPPSGRILGRFVTEKPLGEVWTVFDTNTRRFVGNIGTGAHGITSGYAGLDAESGRLYVLHHDEGLYIADIRRTPLGQALLFPEFRHQPEGTPQSTWTDWAWPLVIDAGSSRAARRIFTRFGRSSYKVIEDDLPVSQDVENLETVASLDLEEQEGVTATEFGGTARGYGARLLLVGGAEAATRLRFLDPVGNVRGGIARNLGGATGYERDPCADANREFILGFIGPKGANVVDADGARGTAVPVVIDGTTAANLETPVSQCTRMDWDAVWSTALFGRAPMGEPGAAGLLPTEAQCLEDGDGTTEPFAQAAGDPAYSPFFAKVSCSEEQASGFSYARGGVSSLGVAESLSSFRIYRDPGRGVVARVESVVRGISIGGAVSIDTVRGVAESWANGRRQPMPEADRGTGYDPNCDYERTAGTCFRRHLFGVRTAGWSCGPCGDEQAFVTGVKRAFQGDAEIRLRQPDARLARGLEDGSAAAVVKNANERFADMLVNQDLLQTVVPTLEIIRFANPSPAHPLVANNPAPGRQIYQFAGVEVGSTYQIQCLLIYDPETNTCAAEAEAPAELKIQLTDAAEKPLAGGGFEIREDVDADGVLGLADKLVPDGACVTTDDGTGTCSFSALKPGTYLVSQVVAPPGYTPTKEPFPVELVSGESRTVVFTNTSSLSSVNIKLESEDGQPLSGGSFAIYPDPDADGKVAPDAQPAAKCDTAADGTCSMTVPAGSYVLVQTAAPDGLEPIEPVPFVISSGGQVAAVEAVNYPFGTPPEAAPAAGPSFTYQPPPAELPPELHTVPLPTMGIPQDQPEVAPEESTGAVIGNTVERIVRAPGDALRLLARSPAEAIAFSAAVLLFALACAAIDRRRKLLALTAAS